MNLRMRFAVALYPKWWRMRYGAEFEALLAQPGAYGWSDWFNLIEGALLMQFRYSPIMKMALACGLACGVIGAIGALVAQQGYVAKSVLSLRAAPGAQSGVAAYSAALRDLDRTARANSDCSRDIEMTLPRATVTVNCNAGEPDRARRLGRTDAANLMRGNVASSGREAHWAIVSIQERAPAPRRRPDWWEMALLGFLGGALAAAATTCLVSSAPMRTKHA